MFSNKIDPRTFSRKVNLILVVSVYRGGVINQEYNFSYIPEDLKHLKEITKNQIVVMERKTHEAIIRKIGGPLPERKTVILTDDKNYHFANGNCQVISENPLNKVLEIAKHKKVFVIGEGKTYKLFMPFSTKIIANYLDLELQGEDIFPEVGDEWEILSQEKNHCPRSKVNFQQVTYIRESRT